MPNIRLQEYTTKIGKLIRDNRQDEAIAHCLHILHLYPKHIQSYRLLGEACLQEERLLEARDCFQRTLSADPENVPAWIGLASTYEKEGKSGEALWLAQRALELAAGNAEVRRKVQSLRAQQNGPHQVGTAESRLKLTRGALGRVYARNGLYERAIGEFRAVLQKKPDLPEIRVALAEGLWREERLLEAVEVCVELLDKLPNCLKANLILGTIELRSGERAAGEARLTLAQALDPENLVAQEMMGGESPLPYQEVFVPELAADVPLPQVEARAKKQSPVEEIPEWVRGLEM